MLYFKSIQERLYYALQKLICSNIPYWVPFMDFQRRLMTFTERNVNLFDFIRHVQVVR